MSAAQTTCARCGGAVAGNLAFCTHCGSPLAAAPPVYAPPPAYEPPTYVPPTYVPPGYVSPTGYSPPQPPRRRRTGLVVAWVAVAVLLVAGGVTAGFLLLDDEPEDAHVFNASDGEPSPSDATSPSLQASVAPPEPSSPSLTPVQCWNGPAARLADCTSPTGRRGIRWVFPSMKNADCTMGAARRLQIWNCYDALADGTLIRFNYSQWYNFASAATHYRNPGYRGEFSETRMPDGRLRWFSYDLDKAQYKAAFAYDRAPWSVTIYADTKADRDAAVRDLLVMRPREQLRGIR